MAQEQFIPDLPQQQQFIPQFDESTTRQYIKLYQKNPSLYNENYLTGLRNHAYHYNIPFYEGEFSVFEAIKQAGAGLVEGFTTLNLAEHPDNVYEQIARNVGHLVGFAPGIIANPMSRIKALRGIAATIPKRGIPLAVAEDVFEPYAKKIANKAIKSSYLAKTEATQEAVKFLTTPLAKDIATGAFRLGTASGISAWQGGVDAMVDSFFHGAVAGGVFKLIGNKINAQDPNAEKFARGLAGSLFMGLPSTLRGATMPEQIYEYLMGAYFGGNEVPWTKSRAAKLHTQNKKEAFANSKAGLEYNLDPKQFSTWKNAEPEVKKELVKMAEAETEMLASQRAGILGYELAEKLAELGHPQYIKQIEALKDPKKSGPEELAYNKELKKQGTLQKEVEKLNSEAKSLETDLYNTEFDFKRIYEKQDVELIKKRQEKTKGDVRWDFSEYSITPKGRVLLKSDKEFTKWQELFNKKIVKLNETEQRGFKADQVLQGQTLKTKKLKPKSKPLRKVILTTGSPGLESVASKAASKHNIQTVQGKLQGREMASKAGQGIVSQISEASLESVNTTLNKAFESANKKGEVVGTTPLKPETYKPEAIQRLRRNTFLIQNSNDIVIFGELNSSLDGLAKFNRVIGEVAINSKKPFYVYGSQGEKGNKFWWKYDPNKDSIVNPKVKGMFDFITTTPELGDRTAFFGPLKVSQGEAAEVNKLFSNQQYKGSKEMSRDLTAKETSLNFDIMDVGPAEGVNIILNSQLGSKINFGLIREKGFVKNYPNPSDRVNAIAKITETAIKNSKEFLETKNDMKGVFETRSQDWINSIEKTLPKNVKLTPKLKGELRAWLVMAKYGKPVNIFASDGKPGNTTLIDPETGISLNMKIKKRVAPESVIDEIYKKYEGEAVKPTQPAPLKPETIKPNVTNFPMNFKDGTGGRKMRPEFKGKSTMDLIESGDRTATSRSLKEQANKPVKKGDIVEMYDKNTGKRILVRATTDLYSLDKVTPEQWSQLEGWAPARHAELLKKGYKQFRFELIKPDSKPATHPRYGDYTPIEISSENINNILNTNKSLASKLEAPNLFGVIAKKGTSLDPSIVNKIASDYNKRYKTPEGEKTQISNLEYAGQIGAREIFKADVNGKTALFYRSSSGTSGDYKNRIMPFMGIGGKNFESPWFIKKIASRKDYEGGLSFYTKSIQEAAKKLDSKFKVPKNFVSGREQLMNILDKSQAKQQIKPTAGPKITAGPKNGYIDSVLFNGQDVELIRFEQKASHYLESELNSKGENKYKTYEEISEKAKEMKKDAIKNIVKDMEEMHNMHLWGGEGDKDRLVFVKYHPMTDTVKLPTDKKFTDMLNEIVKYGKENYGLTREQEIRGMKSMLKYHEDINGLPMNQFIGKDGFIDNTVKMNKRLPVILNSGWRGDKALMNTLGLNLSNKGNFKAIIVKTKKALKDLLELTNSEMEQIRDGATLSEMKTMDALHLDRGSKYVQGNEKSIVMDGPLMLKHMVHNTSPELSEAMRNFKTNNPELGDGLNFIIYDTSSKQTGNIKAGGYKFERGKTKKKIIKTGFEIEQEWNTYVDTPNPTDPTQLGSKLIIRRNDAFLKKDKKTGKMVDMFDPVRSKIQFANTMTKEGKGNYIYNETANRFEDIIKIETTKNELLVEGAEIFEIDPGSFRYNYGVYDGPSNLGIKNGVYKGIPMPKQTLILPNAEMKNVSKEIPLDFFDTLVGESFKGTKEANTELTLYKKELAEKGVAIPGTEFEIVKEHFHNMGVKEIQDILTKPEYEKLSQEMILEMMNVSREAQERLMLEGESFYGNITDSMQNIAEFTTTADNIIKHASALGREALPLFHGKYTKEFVEKAVENWLIDKVMSPRVKNSIKGRLRPYTEFELDVKYPEFDSDAQAIKKHGVKADELVVLGDLYFDTPFYNPLTNKWSTLQKVWNKYQKSTGFEKNEYKSLFDGLTVRIPQDSASGAQVLRFAGFSGIKDHGILIHGRAMEKLGGADLDADSAFMYFGGRRADGSGEGMKQEWLQMYKNQKDEFTSRGEVFPTDIESPGSRLTARFANDNNKPYIVNPTGKELADFIKRFGIKEINVAGSRPKGLKVYPDKDVNITKKNIEAALKEGLKDVEFVRSGGQLGADMIGLEVARLLGKKTRGVAPPGYLQGKTPAKDILKSFGLIEGKAIEKTNKEGATYKDIYTHRTAENVKQSDGTVIFAPLYIKQPPKKPVYSQVKDMHHHEVVLNPETIKELNIPENIFNYTINKNDAFPYAQFSPTLRGFVGEQTASSRALMSDVVSMTQNHRAAWASVIKSPIKIGKRDKTGVDVVEEGTISKKFDFKTGAYKTIPENEQTTYRIIRAPKTSEIDKLRQLTLSSALIRFTADPANELGLINRQQISRLLTDAYYQKPKVQILHPERGWMESNYSFLSAGSGFLDYPKSTIAIKRLYAPNITKQSRFNLFSDINRAFYGQDFNTGKKFTYDQKQELIKGIDKLTEPEMNTALPRLAKMMQGVDLRMSIFDRVNQTSYNKTLNDYNKLMKSLPEKDVFKKLLDRTKLDYPESKQITFMFDKKLQNSYKRELMSESNPADIIKEFRKADIKDYFHEITPEMNQKQVKEKLDKFVKTTEEFLENSVWEMGGFSRILEIYKDAIKAGQKISDREFSEMFENAEFIKKIDKSNLEQRRILKSSLEETSTASKKNDPEIQVWLDLVNAEKGKAPETTGTKILDQVRIDNAIRDFKNRLSSKYAKDMFDTLLLSSFRNKNVSNQIKNTYESLPYKSEMQKDALRFLYKREGARTGSTRAAFNSREVSSSNIKKFLESMNEFYKQAGKAPKISPKVEKHIEKFEKSKVVELFDPEVRYREILEPEIGNSLIGDIVGMENMRKGKLTPEQSKVVSEFANLIVTDPNFNMEKLNRTLMGLYTYIDPFDPVTKSVDQWNLSDFRRVINTYKEIKQGGVFKHWEKQLPLLKRLSLKARNQMQFPLMVSNEQMAEDIVFMQRKGFLKDWAGKEAKEVDMLYPTSWGEVLQSQIHRMTSMQEAHSARLSNEFMEDINFLNQTKDGMALHNIALAKIELKQRELLDNTELKQAYVQKWEKLRDLYGWRTTASGRTPLFQKDYMLDMDGSGRRSYKGWQVVNHLMKTIESKYEKLFELNSGVFDKIHKDEWNLLSKKEQEKYDDVGNGFYSKHPLVDYTLGYYDKLQTQRRLDVKKFMRDLRTAWAKGPDKALDFALNVGSDGMRQLMRSMAIENLKTEQYIKEIVDKKTGEITEEIISAEEYFNLSKKEQKFYKPDTEKKLKTLEKLIVPETGYRKGYIPHYFNDTKASKEVMMKEQNEIRAKFEKELEGVPLDSKMYKKISNEYVQEMKANFMKYKFQNGDYDLGRNQDYITTLDRMMFKRVKDELAEYETDRLNTANLQSITRRTGNQRSRENHKLDYMMDPVIHGIYIQNATKNLYDTMTNLITRETLHNMHKRNTQKIAENPKWFNKITKEAKKGKEKDYEDALEVVRNWDWFWRQYTREAMGAPSIVSSEAWNNPNLHVSTTPYGWFADNIFANRLNKIGESLNLLNKDKELPKELQQLDNYDVQKIGTLEARFQLATLMTHPKTPINNIFGGTMHTFQSAGYEPLRKAYDYEYLKTINRKFENEEGVIRHLDEHGIQVELAKHELGLDKSLRGIKNEEFIDAVSAKAKGGQEIAKAELEALRKKHGVTKPIMDLAAKFMSIPERRLRRDAYLAHYIKAWERFGGSIKNPDSPILIELAKKGVKATQFLYSAPFRPAFARSALGKTMTRFQLWAWNAVRFRNDVRKLAKRYGYKPGSEGMKKFERMMTTDLFVMALGSLFMYSMFEQTIPAPYGWIQDTAQWVFGDEKERDRAFFGTYPSAIAPLQMITPPIARFPISIIREFAEDDYTKLADYYIWTMFPFGRMGRDLLHPEQNIFKNPMRIPEKVFGFPLTGFSQHAKRMREENYEPITPGKSIDIF